MLIMIIIAPEELPMMPPRPLVALGDPGLCVVYLIVGRILLVTIILVSHMVAQRCLEKAQDESVEATGARYHVARRRGR